MSNYAGQDPWADFEGIKSRIYTQTMDRLKHYIAGFNEECGLHISKTGRKQEIVTRITNALDNVRLQRNIENWERAKGVINYVRTHGTYVTPGVRTLQSSGAGTSSSHMMSSNSSGIRGYDPYAPPRRPIPPSSSLNSNSSKQNITFKPSPFFRIDTTVSNVVECPESASATDRRSAHLTFTLTDSHVAKLKSSDNYKLKLFCTSSTFHSPSSFRTSSSSCPIEFPPTCEVRCNNTPVSANLKGLKKKPGTAPPAELTKWTPIRPGPGRIEMVYVNGQQPVTTKKFYLVVMLVQGVTIEQLVGRLHRKNADEIKRSLVASLKEDEDIIAGPSKMSLKCPLSYARVTTPSRSSKCVHSQCFDATSWYSVMEQTTTWLCPVCEKEIDPNDLIVDGYFAEILQQTPDSVDDVIVEADGEWHTADNKHASALWKATHAPTKSISQSASSSSPAQKSAVSSSVSNGLKSEPSSSSSIASKGISKGVEILILDSDEEDEGQVKQALSSSTRNTSLPGKQPNSRAASTSKKPSAANGGDVIDLTLDSDEEEPPPQSNGKRKASSSDLNGSSFKKSRIEILNGDSKTAGDPLNSSRPSFPSTTLPPLSATSYMGSSSRTNGWS